MRIRMLALSGALAASTVLIPPAMATDTTPTVPGTTTTAPAPAPVKFRNSCNPAIAALPPTVEGQPAAFVPGAAKGVYVWHEKAGWRLRVTHPQARDAAGKPSLIEVRGRITSSRPLSNVRTVRLEDKQRGEWVSVQRPKRKVMDFRFVNGGFIDGINFTAGCAGRLGFTVWEITKDDTGKVVRTPLPVFVGSVPTEVTGTTLPSLATNAPAGVAACRDPALPCGHDLLTHAPVAVPGPDEAPARPRLPSAQGKGVDPRAAPRIQWGPPR